MLRAHFFLYPPPSNSNSRINTSHRIKFRNLLSFPFFLLLLQFKVCFQFLSVSLNVKCSIILYHTMILIPMTRVIYFLGIIMPTGIVPVKSVHYIIFVITVLTSLMLFSSLQLIMSRRRIPCLDSYLDKVPVLLLFND